MRIATTACLFLSLFGSPALADDPKMSLNDLLRHARTGTDFRLLFSGLGQGLAGANTELALHGQPKLFCPPVNLVIAPEQYASILENYIENNPIVGIILLQDLGQQMLRALIEVFPCAK